MQLNISCPRKKKIEKLTSQAEVTKISLTEKLRWTHHQNLPKHVNHLLWNEVTNLWELWLPVIQQGTSIPHRAARIILCASWFWFKFICLHQLSRHLKVKIFFLSVCAPVCECVCLCVGGVWCVYLCMCMLIQGLQNSDYLFIQNLCTIW